MPNGNGSNGVGAEADATAQRKRGAQSDVFGAPRVRIYPPFPSSGSERRFCAFRARVAQGQSLCQTIRSTCRIRWTWCAQSGPLLGGRVCHTGCRAAGHTSGRKTWVRFRERGAMQRKPTSQCNTAANSWDCAPVAGGTLSLEEYGKGSEMHVVHVCILW
jgi:hypothetical protein